MTDIWHNADNVALLGTMHDGALAKHLGTTAAVVFYERKRRGIPPHTPRGRPATGVKSIGRHIKLPAECWAIYDELGGTKWLKQWLAQAAQEHACKK